MHTGVDFKNFSANLKLDKIFWDCFDLLLGNFEKDSSRANSLQFNIPDSYSKIFPSVLHWDPEAYNT